LKKQKFLNYIKTANLDECYYNNQPPLLYAIINNNELQLEQSVFTFLIKNTNLTKKLNHEFNSYLAAALKFNSLNKIYFTTEQFDILFKKSNLNITINSFYCPLSYIFEFNRTKSINITKEQLDFLLIHTNYKKIKPKNHHPLHLAIMNNELEKLNINENQFQILAENYPEIKKTDKVSEINNIIIELAQHYKKQNLSLNEKTWDILISKTDFNIKDIETQPLDILIEFFNENNNNELYVKKTIELLKKYPHTVSANNKNNIQEILNFLTITNHTENNRSSKKHQKI
jgi:hypothetical protein